MPNVAAKKDKESQVPAPSTAQASSWSRWLKEPWPVCIGLLALVAAVFWPVYRFDFVNYDDPDYVSANPHVQTGLTWQNLRWALTTGHASNWHPLTWLSHMLDWQLFGNNPGAQHLVSVVIHALNTLLLYLVLRRMTGAHWRCAIAAILFGIHPLRAESVAWISERKDVLSTLFFFLCLGAYALYVENRKEHEPSSGKVLGWYCAALGCFALGLMSKPMLVTVPCMLLLLDYWPLQRFTFAPEGLGKLSRLVVEKIPFAVLAGISSVVTFLVQRKGGAVSTSLALSERVANALVSYVRYIGKTLWPTSLSVLYPHPGHWPFWTVAACGVLVLLISILAIREARRLPVLFVGWFWFAGGLVPVIGLVQVGIQSMADRYTYIPNIGLSFVLVWGLASLLEYVPAVIKPAAVILILTAPVGLALACAYQIQSWKNSETLFQRAVDVTSNNYLAYNNLGFYLSSKGDLVRAKENYRKSLAINPAYSDALNNLGFALAGEKNYPQAIACYEAALRVSPNHPEIHNNLGNALSEIGKLNEAIAQYELVLQLQPDHADAHNNLGIALAMQGKLDQALTHFRDAIRAKPAYASAHSNLGNALAAQRKIPEAIAEYRTSLLLNPRDAQAHNNLGNALLEEGNVADAIEQYGQALALNQDNPEAHFNLAVALARQNKRAEAATHFREVLRLAPGNAEARRQLDALSKPN